jgi:hypothetical protein
MKAVKFLMIAGVVMAAGSAFARPEPHAFLNKAAWTHSALMNQVRTDAQVMSRFQRHFGMNRTEVVNLLGSLRAGTLNQDGVYLVYNASNDEEIRARVMFYKKGTKVWENAAGEPVLKMSCANPMVRGTDDQAAVLQTSTPIAEEIRPVEGVASGEADPEVLSETMPVEVTQEAQPLAALTGATTVDIPLAEAVGRSAFNPLYLTPLGAIPFIRRSNGNEPAPPPVPEPGTMIALGAGAAFLAARRKAKKS